MKKEKIYNLLKLSLKVLIVCFACIGVVLTGFLVVGSIKNKLDQHDEQNKQLVVRQANNIKQVANYNNVVYFSATGDILSENFVEGCIRMLISYGYNGFDIENTTYTGTQVLRENYNDTSEDVGFMYQWNSANNQHVGTQTINYIAVTKSYEDLNPKYVVDFNTSNGVVVYSMTAVYYKRFYYESTQIGNLWGISSSYSSWWIMQTNNNFNQTLMNKITGLSQTYNEGFSDGYKNGEVYGYNVGYDVGYDVGYEAQVSGMTHNPFNLISNAFESLANILEIQIIPGLTLGVLIFTPLIFGLIIVLFKMIRG